MKTTQKWGKGFSKNLLLAGMAAIITLALPFGLVFMGCDNGTETTTVVVDDDPSVLKYWLVHEPFPDFQRTTKVIIDAGIGKTFKANEIENDTFLVHMMSTVYYDVSNNEEEYDGFRNITGTFVTGSIDEPHNLISAESGRYLVLELLSHREESAPHTKAPGAQIGQYEWHGNNMFVPFKLTYTITQKKTFNRYGGDSVEAINAVEYSFAKSTKKYNKNERIPGEITVLVNLFSSGRYDNPDSSKGYLEYRFYTPTVSHTSLPLVIWLHGMGEGRPADGTTWAAYGGVVPDFLKNTGQMLAGEIGTAWVKPENQAARPAYVLVPQSSQTGWGVSDQENLKAVIDELLAGNSKIDFNRIYLTGDSMGGMGTLDMLQRYPEFFAAAITAPGGSNSMNTGHDPGDYSVYAAQGTGTSAGTTGATGIPIWMVTIDGDFMAGMSSLPFYTGLKTAGANVRWTFYPDVAALPENYGNAHGSWFQVLLNRPKTDDANMVISASAGANFWDPPNITRGHAGMNPNDSPGDTIMEWLFKQHR
jgi:predicted peptidase